MDREELIAFVKENLSLDIESSESYTGGMDGTDMYSTSHVIKLMFCGETLSEEYLD